MANAERLIRDIKNLRSISEPCEAGITRIGFTTTYRQGVEYVKSRMRETGLNVREDNIGNIYGRMEGADKSLPTIVSGSHLDTVRCAGAYDGISGVVCALEAARMLQENGIVLRHPFEVLGTIEEEGTRFGQVVLGSQYIVGKLGEKDLDAIHDSEGMTLREACREYITGNTCPVLRKKEEIAAVLELHDEQGPILDKEKIDIGIVRKIVGISWLTVVVKGFAGHAGTVPMPLRQDAVTGAAHMIQSIADYTTKNYSYQVTATVGKVDVLPGSSNCIPSRCMFTVDLRSGDMSYIDELSEWIKRKASVIENQFHVKIDVYTNSRQETVNMDDRLCTTLLESCKKLGYSSMEINSGAGHDAMIFADHWPTAMLFVPCANGITHNPEEYVSPEALAKGTDVLYRTIIDLDQKI